MVSSIRTGAKEKDPNFHLSLEDRAGKKLGLTMCDPRGDPHGFFDAIYNESPVFTTAFKQTSGQGGYDIFNYPYSPTVQDNTDGGRANLDFERDTTRFYDSYRANSGRANKAFAGPQEQYVTGAHRSVSQSMPGSVDFVQMTGNNRYIYKRILISSGFTSSKIWLNLKRVATPGYLTIKLYSDAAGAVGTELDSLTVDYTWTNDTLSEWLNDTLEETLTGGANYWLVLIADEKDTDKKHWKVAVKEEAGTTYAGSSFDTTPDAATFDLYYRLTDAETNKTCIPFEYKEAQYFVVSGATGAPDLYMVGDRGAADSNSGNLNKLIDGTKSWTTDEWVGAVVMITAGPGKLEAEPWRTVLSNTATELVVDGDWTIAHTTSTEYVLLGTKIKKITGHGLTSPVTDVCVSPTGVVYFCMGDGVTVRRGREFNNAGAWQGFDNAANCQANEGTLQAVFMVYKPQIKRFVYAINNPPSVNINSDATVPSWGTNLTWGTAQTVDNAYRKINGLKVHPDTSGNEAVWCFKIDMPFMITGTTTISGIVPAGSDEMRNIRSIYNGVRAIKHDVYLYIPLLYGLAKYYGGQYTNVGPDMDEGLPENRRGPIVDMVGYLGKFFVAVDGGASGYSSVMDSGGYHERYRAPKGRRIKAMAFQVVPGTTLDRLWIYQGNDFVWLPFPSNGTNELDDANYPYTHEFCVQLSRMHAGLYDVQKMIALMKLQTDRLEVDEDGKAVCKFRVEYRIDGADEWTALDKEFTQSPTQEVDFKRYYGLAGKRLEFRIIGETRDAYKTPVFLAIIFYSVLRVDVKRMYGPFAVRLEDGEMVGLREKEADDSAVAKLAQLRAWGDASSDSMLLVKCVSSLYDGKMVFLNLGTAQQVSFRQKGGKDVYVVNMSLQDA